MSEMILVLGGARSGKSRFAEQLAAGFGSRVLYLATAEASDAEMIERVRRHRAQRPASWGTVEAPVDPVAALRNAASGWDTVLFECLSLWISNLLLASLVDSDELAGAEALRVEQQTLAEVRRLLEWQREAGTRLIVVSNEAGLGVVPPYPLGRLYRDVLGRANQLVAAEAQQVYYLVAGLGLELKALGASNFPSPLLGERPAEE